MLQRDPDQCGGDEPPGELLDLIKGRVSHSGLCRRDCLLQARRGGQTSHFLPQPCAETIFVYAHQRSSTECR